MPFNKQSAATFTEIESILQKEGVNQHKNIIILCEPNETENSSESEIFDSMIATAKSISDCVTISSALPCLKDQQKNIETFNRWLKNKCQVTQVTFVDNDQNFVFRDGSFDKSAFAKDGQQLSWSGISRLVSSLSLEIAKPKLQLNKRKATSYSEGHQKKVKLDRVRLESCSSQTNDKVSNSYKLKDGQCPMCGETNHVTHNCKHKSMVTCFTCGGVGHKDKHHTRPGQ